MILTIQSFSFICVVSVAYFYFWRQASFLHRRIRGYGGVAAVDIGNHGIVMVSQSLRCLTKALIVVMWWLIFLHIVFVGPEWIFLLWFIPLLLTVGHTVLAWKYEDGWYEADDIKSKLRSK